MSEFTDGGRAFPFVQWRSPDGMMAISTSEGMSLRDYFAAKAMQAMMNNEQIVLAMVRQNLPSGEIIKTIASDAYSTADAMLAAREANK